MKALATYPIFERTDENQWKLANDDGIPMLATLFGTTSPALAMHWLDQYLNAFPSATEGYTIEMDPNLLVQYLKDVQAKSNTEALLALNMLLLQEQTFLLSRRLANTKYPDGFVRFTNCISKLSSAFSKQADALAKLRGKSGNTFLQQVNVNDGGQAVVTQGT
jgi:hypothetical protein